MIKNFILMVVALTGLTNIIDSFIGKVESETIIGIEVNIWIYRIFWALISILIYYYVFQNIKSKKIKKQNLNQ